LLRVGVISLGAPYHGNIFVNNMNATLKHYSFEFIMPSKEYGWQHVDPRNFDILWFYGFHALPDLLISKFKAKNPTLKVVVDWVGSDILEFVAFIRVRPQCKDCIINNVDVHVADGLNLVKELDSLGIKASYVPSVPEKGFELKPLPEKFAVAAYVPGFRADFFNFPMINEAAWFLNDVEFNLFGGGDVAIATEYANVHYRGWVEADERRKWWEASSVALYLPQHGSLGLIAIEFLQMGRWVISTLEYAHVFKCSTVDELVWTLESLKERKEGNIEGSKYYLEQYSAEKQAEKVKEVLDKL